MCDRQIRQTTSTEVHLQDICAVECAIYGEPLGSSDQRVYILILEVLLRFEGRDKVQCA